MNLLRFAAAVALCGPAIGCGGAQQAEVQAGFADMKREMRGLRDAYEAQSRRLEAVQDRLALVEDQLESRALHGAPVPQRLPVVRLSPQTRAAPAPTPAAPVHREPPSAPPMPEAPREVASGTITQADVDALDGPAPRRSNRRRRPVPPPANAANAGNIGVARLQPQPDFDSPRIAAPTPPSARAAAAATTVDEPIAAFKAAERLYRAGDLVTAIGAFEAFVQRWPKHGYADNAVYLGGRCHYARADYGKALAVFREVLTTYPAGNQVPDALLMIGLTQSRLGRTAEGRETLARLQAMYPDTAAARQAAAELDRSSGRM